MKSLSFKLAAASAFALAAMSLIGCGGQPEKKDEGGPVKMHAASEDEIRKKSALGQAGAEESVPVRKKPGGDEGGPVKKNPEE